jgi:hypothetical protein
MLGLGMVGGLAPLRLGASGERAMGPAESAANLEARLSRFMMKGDFPRLEVITPAYRFIWHGRFFGFRLISTTTDPYDERISYSNFGPFSVGGVDLVCDHYQPLSLRMEGGAELGLGAGRRRTSARRPATPQTPQW